MSYISDFCNETEALLLSCIINQQSNNSDSSLTLKNHFINLFLRRFLPSTIKVSSGIIFDHFGSKSTYQNLILYRSDFPIFPTTTDSKLFLVESVVATLEIIQPSINPDLIQPFKNSAKVKNLKTGRHRIFANNSLDYMELTLRTKPKTFLFSFQSPWDHQYFIDQYNFGKQEINSAVPDGVCFLGSNTLYAKYDPEFRLTNFYYDEPFIRFFQHLFQLLVGEINSNNMKRENNASIIYDLNHYFNTFQDQTIP